MLDAFDITKGNRGNAKTHTDEGGYRTNVEVFGPGDMRRARWMAS